MEKDEGLWCPHWHPQNTWEEVEAMGIEEEERGITVWKKCSKVKMMKI